MPPLPLFLLLSLVSLHSPILTISYSMLLSCIGESRQLQCEFVMILDRLSV